MRRGTWVIQYAISILRVFSVFMVAFFLPKFYMWQSQQPQAPLVQADNIQFKLGIENLSDTFFKWFQAGTQGHEPAVGLITNQTGTDQEGNRTADLLAAKGIAVKKVLTPQGSSYEKIFTKKMLADLDVLMFDMQDSGMRYYGYVTMLLQAMEAAGKYNKKFVVFDRPNLLGWCMEGVSTSDVTMHDQLPVPMRHGMTIGELASYFNKHVVSKALDLHVVPMQHYDRQAQARKPLMCSLSKNITTIDSCYGYSFLGLLGEVAPFDIGIGTDKAFQCILLPERMKFARQKWSDLRGMLKGHGIESKFYRYFSDRKKEYYAGLRLYIKDINHFSSFKTLLTVLDFFKKSGVPLQFSDQFDKALGTSKVRFAFEGSVRPADLASMVNVDLQVFFKKAFSSFLYKPFPKMVHV